MASLQELRKRLRSIQSTGQLAGAMRTAATAKYARVSRVREEFSPYADACRDMLRMLGSGGIARECGAPSDRACFVVFGGNRGLCGGFNAELIRFLDAALENCAETPLLLVCGKKAAAHLRERGVPFEEYSVSDVPSYDEIKPVAARLRSAYVTGEAGRVTVLYQSFKNMLTQLPAAERLLPGEEAEGAEEAPLLLFLPDRETIGGQLAVSCLDARLFGLALENASGAQAATIMAMRSACDNAAESAANLEITINRRRQAEVTSSVIETASGSLQQGD